MKCQIKSIKSYPKLPCSVPGLEFKIKPIDKKEVTRREPATRNDKRVFLKKKY